MSFAFATALKDIKRRLSDPMALIVWLIIPVALGGMMRLIFGSGTPDITAHVFVVDQDKSLVSRLLLTAGGQAASFSRLKTSRSKTAPNASTRATLRRSSSSRRDFRMPS